MSDWDFLYEMNDRGYSPEEIADAAGSGAAPWEWEQIANQEIKAEQKDKRGRQKRIVLNKCRIVFFDLEFYVPESSRTEHGFCYNPWNKSCKFLGGSFLVTNPTKDFGVSKSKIERKIQSLWLWDRNSERELLENIYELLKTPQETVFNAHNGMVSPILCGIGISSSDLPILFSLFERFKILTNSESFSFQNKFRVIDLSQLTIGTFNTSNNFLYPKTKNHILNKYLKGKAFESGKSVWQLYESGDYKGISERVIDEVSSTHTCYELIMNDFKNFKSLENREKKRQKELSNRSGNLNH